MKTSFYIVLWILVYPLLGLLDSNFINQNSFLVAIIAIFAISYLLNRAMPKHLVYARASEALPILEHVYNGDVEAFRKRLSFDTVVETTSAVSYCVALAVILVLVFEAGLNNLIALVIFALLAVAAISGSAKYIKAKSALSANPTGEQCRDIAYEVYRLDYAAYYNDRMGRSYRDMMPARPPHFKVFQIATLLFAAVCTLLGLYYFIIYLSNILEYWSIAAAAFYGMYFLYGSLAICFGVKDAIAAWKSLKSSASEV